MDTALNTYRTGCVSQEFADAIFHLVREKYTELAGCSSLLHARHKGLAGIVMTRGTATLQSTRELLNRFNIERKPLYASVCLLDVAALLLSFQLHMKYLVFYHLWNKNWQSCRYIRTESSRQEWTEMIQRMNWDEVQCNAVFKKNVTFSKENVSSGMCTQNLWMQSGIEVVASWMVDQRC